MVSYPIVPSIVSQPQDQTVTEWTDAQFNCTASGSPPFNIVWGKVGGDLPLDASEITSDVGSDMVSVASCVRTTQFTIVESLKDSYLFFIHYNYYYYL